MTHIIVILPLLIAAIAFFAGLFHFFFYLINREHQEEIYYSLACLMVGCYNIATGLNYAAHDQAAAIFWQTVQVAVVPLETFFANKFVASFLKFKSRLFDRLNLLMLLLLPVVLFVPGGGFIPERPSHKIIFGHKIFEAAAGPLLQAAYVYVLLMGLWVAVHSFMQWRRGVRYSFVFMCIYIVFLLGGLNDSFFIVGFYVLEYCFIFIIVFMSIIIIILF